jgi:hypothetical protein
MNLPLHDATQWPLRMTKAEVAHVCRGSVRTIERRVADGVMPGPDGDGFFLRVEIVNFLNGNVRKFDRQRKTA